MASDLLKKVWSFRSLERAWRVIEENSRTSKSEAVKREVDAFKEKTSSKLRSLSSKLSGGSFGFGQAKGIPLPKNGGKKLEFRPIVLATVESRIVQRAILNVLLEVTSLQRYVHTPHSFGGIRRKSESDLAAVPAAIDAVLQSIGEGAAFVICADISKFFTRISKSTVSTIVADAVQDEAFMRLFEKAITVELSNLVELREKADAFPIHDIGERWSHFLTQAAKVDSLIQRMIHHEDAETVFG